MAILIQAALTGQTAGIPIHNYVPQPGDVNAVFTSLGRRATDTTDLAQGLGAWAAGYGIVGRGTYFANATTKLTVDAFDASMVVSIQSPIASGDDYKALFLCDDGASNHIDIDYHQNVVSGVAKYSIVVYSVISGTGTKVQEVVLPTQSGGDHTLSAQMRGSGSSRTLQVLWDGAAIGAAIALPTATVAIGRAVGISGYFLAADTTTNESATVGAKMKSLVVNQLTNFAIGDPIVTATNSDTAVTITTTGATNGSSPYSYQLRRAPDNAGSPGTFANVGSPTTAKTFTDTGLAPGTRYWWQIVATGADSATVTSNNVSFVVPIRSFNLSTNPTSLVLAQAQALTLPVLGSAIAGYTGTATLSCVGLPSGVTASFNPISVGPGAWASVLTLSAAGSTQTGSVEIGVRGTDGASVVTAPVLMQVNPPSGIVYPVVANILDTDLVTITRGGTTDQVAASVLKAYLAG